MSVSGHLPKFGQNLVSLTAPHLVGRCKILVPIRNDPYRQGQMKE